MTNKDPEIFHIPDRIEAAKKDLVGHLREQLQRRTFDYSSDDHRKAAILLLAEMDKRELEEKHKEVITVAKSANNWAMWAVIVGILGLAVGLKDCSSVKSFLLHQSGKNTELKDGLQEQKPASKAAPVPETDAVRKVTSQPKSTTK